MCFEISVCFVVLTLVEEMNVVGVERFVAPEWKAGVSHGCTRIVRLIVGSLRSSGTEALTILVST